ncbi:unnamed protein product [Meloidogyne enterolobii]|uniref:Uncharacterized protein n=3 Tax=Meloidogyne enterolobii TaxID=390850 RepID=A0ACB0XL37_MELEN|nr:unnamed protein product [Meloidogyne enterolobii]
MPQPQQPPLPINEDETAALLARTNDYGYIPPGYGWINGNLLKEHQKQQQQLILPFYSPQGMDNSLFSNDDQLIIPQLKENIKEEDEDGGDSLNKNKILNRSRKEQLALKIDRYSALLFPALFALFNVFYWYHYMTE